MDIFVENRFIFVFFFSIFMLMPSIGIQVVRTEPCIGRYIRIKFIYPSNRIIET